MGKYQFCAESDQRQFGWKMGPVGYVAPPRRGKRDLTRSFWAPPPSPGIFLISPYTLLLHQISPRKISVAHFYLALDVLNLFNPRINIKIQFFIEFNMQIYWHILKIANNMLVNINPSSIIDTAIFTTFDGDSSLIN